MDDPNVHYVQTGGIRMYSGDITLQMAELSRIKVRIKSETTATFAGPRRFVPMLVLRIQLLRDIAQRIWRAYERTLNVHLVF